MIEKINVINQKLALEEANFKRLPRSNGAAKAVLIDEILDFNLNDNKISFKYKRTLKADPESIYRVCVIFSYESDVREDSIELLKQENKFNAEFLKGKAIGMVESTSLCSVASHIISNLTAINGLKPFISPPNYIK